MVRRGRIPNRLKRYRRIHGFTQRQVARMLGMKKSNLISEWEKGVTVPCLDNLLRLCVIYDTSIEDIYADRLQMHRSLLMNVSD